MQDLIAALEATWDRDPGLGPGSHTRIFDRELPQDYLQFLLGSGPGRTCARPDVLRLRPNLPAHAAAARARRRLRLRPDACGALPDLRPGLAAGLRGRGRPRTLSWRYDSWDRPFEVTLPTRRAA